MDLLRELVEIEGLDNVYLVMEGYRHRHGAFHVLVREIEDILDKLFIYFDVSMEGENCLPESGDRCDGNVLH